MENNTTNSPVIKHDFLRKVGYQFEDGTTVMTLKEAKDLKESKGQYKQILVTEFTSGCEDGGCRAGDPRGFTFRQPAGLVTTQ